MIDEIKSRNIVVNGKLEKLDEDNIISKIEGAPMYEVINIHDGKELFYVEHMDRMESTAKSLGRDMTRDRTQILEDIRVLLREENIFNSNIKIVIPIINGVEYFIIYEMKSENLDPILKSEGIHTVAYDFERESPNVKLLYRNFKEQVKAYYESKNAFEALLRSESGGMLEGSRTNLYFVKDGSIYTSASKDVLVGITRTKVLEIINDFGYPLVNETVDYDEIGSMDAAFISGTTVDVLPIATIDDYILNSQENEVVMNIISEFEKVKKRSIAEV